MHTHSLLSFLLLSLINTATALTLTLTLPQSSVLQGQNVTLHWAFVGRPAPQSFLLRLREIEPTARIIKSGTILTENQFTGTVPFDTGILEPGEYVVEAGVGDSNPTSLGSSRIVTVVVPQASTTTAQTSKGTTSSTTMTLPGSVSVSKSSLGTASPSNSMQGTSLPATINITKTALFPASSTSSIEADPAELPVPAPPSNKRFNALPVVLAVVLGGLVLLAAVVLVRYRRRRRSWLNATPEPLPLAMDRRIWDSSFRDATRNRTSQSLPASVWQPDEKVPLSQVTNAFVTTEASGTSSALQFKLSSDCHETPQEEISTGNTTSATSPVQTAPSPILTSPAGLVPSATAHERLFKEVQWWRSQFASSWAVGDDVGGAGAPPSYRGSVTGEAV